MCVDYNIGTKVTDSLCQLIDRENYEEKEKLKEFIKYFYSFVYNSNLKINDKFLLYIAKDVYDFIVKRATQEVKLSVQGINTFPEVFGDFTAIKVINDDMPFLVDSVIAAIKSYGLTICYYSNSIVNVTRENDLIQEICQLEDCNGVKESIIYVVIKGVSEDFIEILKESLHKTLDAVGNTVRDWRAMLQKLNEVNCNDKAHTDFLAWLKNNNFVFLGYKEYIANDDGSLAINDKENLGLIKTDKCYESPMIEYHGSDFLYVLRSHMVSIVHRSTYANCIGIREYSNNGKLVKERRFFGLFTSVADVQDVRTIPIVSNKINVIEEKAGFTIGGHNHKALIAILQTFSCNELFQFTENELFQVCVAIMYLAVKSRVKLFIRSQDSFVNCIVLIPMNYASSNLMFKICDILKSEFNAESSDICSSNIVNEYDLMKLHIVLKDCKPKISVSLDNEVLRIENILRNITENWEDRFIDNLYSTFGRVEDVFVRYCKLFPASYQEKFEPKDAYYDIKKLEIVRKTKASEVDLKLTSDNIHYQLKVYTPLGKGGIELSKILRITKNLGAKILEHNGYYVNINGGIWIHYFVLHKVDELIDNIVLKDQFELTLAKVFKGKIKNDYFNSLVVLAGLKWKEVLLIRAFSAYLKQILFHYNQEYIQKVVAEYPRVTRYLIQLFHARFNPDVDIDREQTTDIVRNEIENMLQKISNVSHDHVLRAIFNLIVSVVRTSYYQDEKPYLTIKFDSSKINNLPKPLPYRELYVYSNLFEGIHLRGGRLARGGLRWSDRTEDFRTEVLGLMKAQMTKNTVIVPVGAKGGFVIKKTYKDKDNLRKRGLECYQNFIRGMLDVTDNVINGTIVPPKNVIRYDDDDPYLVVAADKGTASFSDHSNRIASEYNFWLDDAFASGGSVGYDHKKMGITARGAWIAAQRHFWRINKDIYEEITVIGIGDMSGDLFGNGMLLSKNIRLVGAFNHLHVFIDPNPDLEKSFEERKRLFDMPFSNWTDYKGDLVSAGGGVFDRSSKTINISQEIKERFDIHEDILSPDDLINYLLKARVDFIWNGGIGTFVKASSENNTVVADKDNDALRVNGKEIRASMFIEGGNLGCTQLGRIEYAENGGYINADFVDNACGVICSDLEVNIKIAFVLAMKEKYLSLDERNEILSHMIDEVALNVLDHHSKMETKALLMECLQADDKLAQHHILIVNLEKSGLLDRSVEFLPDDELISRMLSEKKGLTSPQLSVLMSYSRMVIKNEIIDFGLPENNVLLDKYLLIYFPQKMVDRFKEYILKHQLRNEIIATCIANDVVNRMGCVFINNLLENTGTTPCKSAIIYIIVWYLYDLSMLWEEIDSLDSKIQIDSYLHLIKSVQKFIGVVSFRLVKNPDKFCISKLGELAKISESIKILMCNIKDVIDESSLERYNKDVSLLLSMGICDDLATKIASLSVLIYAPDIVSIAEQTALSVTQAAKVYFTVKALLKLDVIQNAAFNMKQNASYWERSAIIYSMSDLNDYYYSLLLSIIESSSGTNPVQIVQDWVNNSSTIIERYNRFLNSMVISSLDLGKLIFVIRKIKILIL